MTSNKPILRRYFSVNSADETTFLIPNSARKIRMADKPAAVRWTTALGDFVILGTVGMVVILIEKTCSPFRRGFFCEDESIRYPVVSQTTFNSKSLAAICLLISFATVLVFAIIFGCTTMLLPCGLILLIFVLAVKPTRRGFFCEDESIRYPFKASTIPNYALYIYGFTIPIAVIILTEILVNRKIRMSGRFLFRPVPIWVLYAYRSFVDFLFGCVCSQLITDVGKYTIGRLRPNFIDVCKPNIDLTNCTQYGHRYLIEYTCTSADDDAEYSRVSFPSGHSSFSAYTMLYIAIYVQVKMQVGRNATLRLFKHGFQLSIILLSYFTALSRVMDNKHHWSDVLAGGLIGSITAAIVARYVSGLLKGTAEFTHEKSFDDLTGNIKRGRPINSNNDIEASIPEHLYKHVRNDAAPPSTSLLMSNVAYKVHHSTVI